MKAELNHIAFLVRDIDSALKETPFPNGLIGKIQEFPSEGTREVYIGKQDQRGRLLLMEAIGDGPYLSALEKRGPGLHHIALDVKDLDSYVEQLAGSGWLLHPSSLKFYNQNRQVFLSRPGTPLLIEIQERKEHTGEDHFIEKVEIPLKESRLLEGILCPRIVMASQFRIFGKNGEFNWPSFT